MFSIKRLLGLLIALSLSLLAYEVVNVSFVTYSVSERCNQRSVVTLQMVRSRDKELLVGYTPSSDFIVHGYLNVFMYSQINSYSFSLQTYSNQ